MHPAGMKGTLCEAGKELVAIVLGPEIFGSVPLAHRKHSSGRSCEKTDSGLKPYEFAWIF